MMSRSSVYFFFLCVIGLVYSDSLNAAQRDLVVNLHNKFRSQIAKGQTTQGDGVNFPPAKNMQAMRYNTEVENYARNYLTRCQFTHSNSFAVGLGENLFMTTESTSPENILTQALENWWSERLQVAGAAKQFFHRSGIGHMTQMAWATTNEVGCAFQKCGGKTLVSCNYKPAGNIAGGLVYEPGTPCNTDTGLCGSSQAGNVQPPSYNELNAPQKTGSKVPTDKEKESFPDTSNLRGNRVPIVVESAFDTGSRPSKNAGSGGYRTIEVQHVPGGKQTNTITKKTGGDLFGGSMNFPGFEDFDAGKDGVHRTVKVQQLPGGQRTTYTMTKKTGGDSFGGSMNFPGFKDFDTSYNSAGEHGVHRTVNVEQLPGGQKRTVIRTVKTGGGFQQ